MQFPTPVKIKWISNLINATIIGDENAEALGINEIHKVAEGDLVFVDHPKYYDTCLKSAASHIIINTQEVENPLGKTLLYVQNPFEAYLKIVNHFRPFAPATQTIAQDAQIGKNTIVMPNTFIGKAVKIGDNCIIHPNVSILDYTEIGNNVIIQSGTVIGSDAFYYNTNKSNKNWFKKMQSCGHVLLEDFVEIGASCTIDRGVTAATVIGSGTKIDNMVHIGHDTAVGKNCLIAAQVGIAGATIIEDGVTLWGQVGVNKTITIGTGSVVLAQSGVVSSLKGGRTYMGYPAEDARIKRRELVWTRRIPELWEKIMK